MPELLPCPTSAAVLMSIDNRVIVDGPDKGLTGWQAAERRHRMAECHCAHCLRRPPTPRDHRAAMARLAHTIGGTVP